MVENIVFSCLVLCIICFYILQPLTVTSKRRRLSTNDNFVANNVIDESFGNDNIIDDLSTDEDTDKCLSCNKFVCNESIMDPQVSPLVSDQAVYEIEDESGKDLQNSESRSDEQTDDVRSLEDFIGDSDANDVCDSNPDDFDDDISKKHL